MAVNTVMDATPGSGPTCGPAFPAPLDATARAAAWTAAWALLDCPAPAWLLAELEQAWGEPQRHYHDRRHLGECLALWTRWRAHCERPGEVAVALWFHDAVYDPRADDNELRSAAWAARSLGAAGVGSAVAQRVHELVMATRHGAPTGEGSADGGDADVLLDIDLAILGSPAERFERYDRDVRLEYADVPLRTYTRRRREVLQSLTARAPLYRGAAALELLEAQAHLNLAAGISRLEQ